MTLQLMITFIRHHSIFPIYEIIQFIIFEQNDTNVHHKFHSLEKKSSDCLNCELLALEIIMIFKMEMFILC